MKKIRRHLHQNPELGMQEFKTTKLIKKELESMGVEIVKFKSKVGILGIIRGAKIMVKEGVLEDPEVDTIVALHCWPEIEVDKIGVWKGQYMASSDKFSIKVIGRGGHGAYPHKSIDAVLAQQHRSL